MATKPKKLKTGKTVVRTTAFIAGSPVGLGTDTRCVVREVRGERLRLERDDGREGSWWVDSALVVAWGA